jgi:hypothetical protein
LGEHFAPLLGEVTARDLKGLRDSLLVLEQAPRNHVKIDSKDTLKSFEQTRGRLGLPALDVRQVDVGHAQCLRSRALGHLPLLSEKPCRLTEW